MKYRQIIITFSMFLFLTSLISCQTTKKINKMNTEIPKISEYPLGEENIAFEKYFIGKSYLAQITKNEELNVPVYNVTFEPGARNNWHSHTGGQILIVVGGEGLYQEKGKVARKLKVGDVVEIAPNVVHWHGATDKSWFSHLAITCNPTINENNWFDSVNNEEYNKANSQ